MGLLLSWVGTGMKLRIPVHGHRIGTTHLLTRTTTFQVAAFVTQKIMTLVLQDSRSAIKSGQPIIPASANTLMGSAIRGSNF
jgi:hypothetical protein